MPVFLAAWLMLVTAPAWAEWVAVGGGDVSVVYVDFVDSSITHKTSHKDGNLTLLSRRKTGRCGGAMAFFLIGLWQSSTVRKVEAGRYP